MKNWSAKSFRGRIGEPNFLNRNRFYILGIIFLLLTSNFYPIHAAGDPTTNDSVYYGGINFDCGPEATVCPENLSSGGSLDETRSFKSRVGEKPIPVRPGYEFVDWEITSVNPQTQYNGSFLKAGDRMTDWNSYTAGNVWNHNPVSTVTWEYWSLDLKAVWEPISVNDSLIPVNLTVNTTPINVTLPSTIELSFNGENVNGILPSSLQITNNNSIGNIVVSNVKATLKDSNWHLTDRSESSYFESLPFDSKEIYLGFSKDGTKYQALSSQGLDPEIMIGPSGTKNSQLFNLEAKTGGSSKLIDSTLVDLVMTLGYHKENSSVDWNIDDVCKKDKSICSESTVCLQSHTDACASFSCGSKTCGSKGTSCCYDKCVESTICDKYARTISSYSDTNESVIKIPEDIREINNNVFADHPEIKVILNETGRSFDWGAITGSTVQPSQSFITGTIKHQNGDIQVIAK